MRWFTLVPKEQGPLAPYKKRPCTPLEDIPPRLYHRTVEDAAFQILDIELTPAFGQSGKMHNYFSSLPLEEMSNQAGVRRDLPIEIVFETSAVLRYAYLSSATLTSLKQPLMACCAERKCRVVRLATFVTPRRTRSCTPGPLTRRHLELQNPCTSPTQVVAVTQCASASTDLAVIPEQPRPRPTTNLEFPCPKCQNNCRVGQFYFGKCRAFARSSAQQCAPNSADGPAASSERNLRQIGHGTVQYFCQTHQRKPEF